MQYTASIKITGLKRLILGFFMAKVIGMDKPTMDLSYFINYYSFTRLFKVGIN